MEDKVRVKTLKSLLAFFEKFSRVVELYTERKSKRVRDSLEEIESFWDWLIIPRSNQESNSFQGGRTNGSLIAHGERKVIRNGTP